MKLDNLDYPTALARVVQGRPQACPNIGFEKQLILWKKFNFHINQRDPLYRIFLMEHNIGLHVEPLALGSEFGYKCRKCRKARVYKVLKSLGEDYQVVKRWREYEGRRLRRRI